MRWFIDTRQPSCYSKYMPFNVNRRFRDESGQVLLIVVLVAVISLTVGLAAVSRSITNTRVSTEESNSQKALSAAEAGLEAQINKANENPDAAIPELDKNFDSSTGYKATVTKNTDPQILINNAEVDVLKTEGADVWLSKYPDFTDQKSPNISVYWSANSGPCSNDAAIEIVILRGRDTTPAAKNDPILERYAVDGCSSRPGGDNNFDDASASTDRGSSVASLTLKGKKFDYRYNIPNQIINGYIMRIIPIYNDAKIGVSSDIPLPAQGFDIESEGTSGETKRKVKVFQSFPTVPIEIFPYNLFNP